MATVTHKVVKGDTLSAIAKRYGTTVDAIAKLNNITNVNLIYVGQVLYISGAPAPSYEANTVNNVTASTPSNCCTILAFGLQAMTDNTLFAIWTYDKSNTDKYEVQWDYYTTNMQWFVGSHKTVDHTTNIQHDYSVTDTYTVPNNAITVRFRVKPISKTYEVKSGDTTKQVSYWTAAWTGYRTYNAFYLNPPDLATPKVEVNGYTLTCRVDDVEVKEYSSPPRVQFEIVKNNSEQFCLGYSKVTYNSASYSCTIDPAHKYKVRARFSHSDTFGKWSNYSEEVFSVPSKPLNTLRLTATSPTSVFCKWDSVPSAESYTLQYATDKSHFDGSNELQTVTNINNYQYTAGSLVSGKTYYFRVRADNSKGSSAWTSVVSITIGTKPTAPTTWVSSNVAIVGEPLIFYWIHNSEDNSKETKAQLWMKINDKPTTINLTNTSTEDEITTTKYTFDTSTLTEGAEIVWSVRTAGATGEYGDWSAERTINVYAKPSLSLYITDFEANPTTVLYTFPFYINAAAGPDTQIPISYHIEIAANLGYETVDEFGNFKMVMPGDIIYSKFYDVNVSNLTIPITPSSVNLQANMSYTVTCTVVMDSGLSVEGTCEFLVSWTNEVLVPNAEIIVDSEQIVTYIRPYCEYRPYLCYGVTYDNNTGEWKRTNNLLGVIDGGTSVDNAFTTDGDIVYGGYRVDLGFVNYYMVLSPEPILVPDVTLSVYRREFDGTFTEIGTGIANKDNTFVTDPHPALDYARYRIVVMSNNTGAISYNDLPGYYIGEKAIVIQWNESRGHYEMADEGAIQDNLWSGSRLKLPYNIDTTESNAPDVTIVDYIGRSHPVSYYGTKIGSTATWSVSIPKHDTETLTALRRLSIWMDDVYVREPSGTGYWANVSVSFKQTHRELTIPVTINITRVSGGV